MGLCGNIIEYITVVDEEVVILSTGIDRNFADIETLGAYQISIGYASQDLVS